MSNPFDKWRADMEEFEERARQERAVLHARRDDIGISLLKEGRNVRQINEMLGIKNPNWLYDACARRGLGTPSAVRKEALATMALPTLDIVPVPDGYRVTAIQSEEHALMTWDERAGAYTPSDVKTEPGSELHKMVRAFGRGTLPFPYPGRVDNKKETR